MKAKKSALEKTGWKKLKNYGKNCEVWKKGRLLLLWNRETFKIYYIN